MCPTLYLLIGGPDNFRAGIINLVAAHFDLVGVTHFEPTQRRLDQPITTLPDGSVEFLFSVSCPQVVPVETLNRVTKAAINFHPGPPRYPGVGSVTRALLDEAADFGVTAHRMDEKPDTGEILAVESFHLGEAPSNQDVTAQTYEALLTLVRRFIDAHIEGPYKATRDIQWAGAPMTLMGYQDLLFSPRLANVPVKQVREALPAGRFYGGRDLLCEGTALIGAGSWLLGAWRAFERGYVTPLFVCATIGFILWSLYEARTGWRAGGGRHWTRDHARLTRVRDHIFGRDPLLRAAYMNPGFVRLIVSCPRWLRVGAWIACAVLAAALAT